MQQNATKCDIAFVTCNKMQQNAMQQIMHKCNQLMAQQSRYVKVTIVDGKALSDNDPSCARPLTNKDRSVLPRRALGVDPAPLRCHHQLSPWVIVV